MLRRSTMMAAMTVAGAVACLGWAWAAPQRTQKGDRDKLSSADRTFVMKAAQGGMMEVDLGRLATERASSEAVKKFGQRMVDDHTKAGDELKSIAREEGVKLPERLDARSESMVKHLSGLKGEAFDRAYMQHMVSDHKKDIADFRKEAKSGRDADVKKWAAQTLPTLEEHMKLASQTSAEINPRRTNAHRTFHPAHGHAR